MSSARRAVYLPDPAAQEMLLTTLSKAVCVEYPGLYADW